MKDGAVLLAALGALAACSACGKNGASSPSDANAKASASASGSAAEASSAAPRGELGPRLLELWTRAKDGEADDLIRLADIEGSTGLVERAESVANPVQRMTAIRALGFCRDFDGLPFLATVATEGADAEATAALESAIDLAARPRRAVDPEDAAELKQGCEQLLALAKAPERPRERRVGAIRALRMLAERGCVKLAEIPGDLDAR